MKKKIKDLTLGQLRKMCGNHCPNCEDCPLSDYCYGLFGEANPPCLFGNLEEEVEVETNDNRQSKKEKEIEEAQNFNKQCKETIKEILK